MVIIFLLILQNFIYSSIEQPHLQQEFNRLEELHLNDNVLSSLEGLHKYLDNHTLQEALIEVYRQKIYNMFLNNETIKESFFQLELSVDNYSAEDVGQIKGRYSLINPQEMPSEIEHALVQYASDRKNKISDHLNEKALVGLCYFIEKNRFKSNFIFWENQKFNGFSRKFYENIYNNECCKIKLEQREEQAFSTHFIQKSLGGLYQKESYYRKSSLKKRRHDKRQINKHHRMFDIITSTLRNQRTEH